MNRLKTLLLSLLLFSFVGADAQQLLCQNGTFTLSPTGQVWVRASQINNGSSGYVHYSINGQDSLLYDCANVGVLDTVFFIGTDILGNTDTCMATIRVMDITPPVMICQNLTVFLSPVTATAIVSVNDINNGSSDVCGIAYLLMNTQLSDTFGIQDLGAHYAYLTALDINGNISQCMALITVSDTSTVSTVRPEVDAAEIAFGLFPNPTSGLLQLRLPAATEQKLQLFNALGSLLQTHLADGETELQLDLQNLSPGTYFLNLKTETGVIAKRFVKY